MSSQCWWVDKPFPLFLVVYYPLFFPQFSSNLPATALRQRTLLLVHLCLGSSHRLQLSLSQLLDYLIKLGYTLLLSLGLHLLQHTHLVISFRSWRSQSNFDANVTETISQVYRWYSYDELD